MGNAIAPTRALAYALREKIIPAVFAAEEYQMPDAKAPGAPLYVRETIFEQTAEQYTQHLRRWSFLCEFDIFCSRVDFPSPQRTLEVKADELKTLFDPASVNIEIPGFRVWIDGLPQCQSMDQEEELFRLPLTFTVVVLG